MSLILLPAFFSVDQEGLRGKITLQSGKNETFYAKDEGMEIIWNLLSARSISKEEAYFLISSVKDSELIDTLKNLDLVVQIPLSILTRLKEEKDDGSEDGPVTNVVSEIEN